MGHRPVGGVVALHCLLQCASSRLGSNISDGSWIAGVEDVTRLNHWGQDKRGMASILALEIVLLTRDRHLNLFLRGPHSGVRC